MKNFNLDSVQDHGSATVHQCIIAFCVVRDISFLAVQGSCSGQFNNGWFVRMESNYCTAAPNTKIMLKNIIGIFEAEILKYLRTFSLSPKIRCSYKKKREIVDNNAELFQQVVQTKSSLT